MFDVSSFVIYTFVTAYTPGPNNIMSMSNAVQMGFKKSFPFNLGIWAGFSVVMSACAVFSAALLQYIPKFRIYMFMVGAAYMFYLAWKVWRSDPEIKAESTAGTGFISGMMLQFINPKIYIYAITSMSVYILPVYSSESALFAFSMLLAFIGFTGTVCWSLFGTVFCKLPSRHAKVLNAVLALLLIYCGVSLFI